jgi:glycyl-tRNA synthetase alpha chain
LIEQYGLLRKAQTEGGNWDKKRFPLLGAYDLCLKCSHMFNILDARGAISVTERVGIIARVRALAVGIAKAWVDQQSGDAKPEEPAPAPAKKSKKKEVAPVS